jgi:transaldolase/glucose-6-phosphate isomerase
VEASKTATRKLTDQYEQRGSLPAEKPMFAEDGITLFTDEKNSATLANVTDAQRTLAGYLKVHLNRLGADDYFALLAYIEMNAANEHTLQVIRHHVRDAKHIATCLAFGPRFLHSTGQAHKGGPNTGVFLQVTCDDAADLPVPGRSYSFGVVKSAQARGDFEVLAERNRRVLRAHLGADVAAGLRTLQAAVVTALKPELATSA